MICTLADKAGFEALVPVARWKGFGGQTNFNGSCFETYTWAAAISAITDQISVLSTSHVPTVHPILAAKQATTSIMFLTVGSRLTSCAVGFSPN